jgi:putative membrane protein
MFRSILLASALAVSAPAFAQAQMAMPMPAGTAMTATDVGVSPLTGISATDYVKMAADSDMFEITTGRLAGTKGQSANVNRSAARWSGIIWAPPRR